MEAEIIFTTLASNNISCHISDQHILWAKPYYNQLLGGVKIWVFEKDLELCRQVLASDVELHEPTDFEIENQTADALICPYCGSANVRYGLATGFRFHLPSVLISIFFRVPVYFPGAWHCFNCYRDFK
jgi:hypothetical protein